MRIQRAVRRIILLNGLSSLSEMNIENCTSKDVGFFEDIIQMNIKFHMVRLCFTYVGKAKLFHTSAD